jgi:hypothetical protein
MSAITSEEVAEKAKSVFELMERMRGSKAFGSVVGTDILITIERLNEDSERPAWWPDEWSWPPLSQEQRESMEETLGFTTTTSNQCGLSSGKGNMEQQVPKIKPLVWHERGTDTKYYVSETVVGKFWYMLRSSGKWNAWFEPLNMEQYDSDHSGEVDTKEEAIAFVQAEYERRVRECLE